MLIDVLGSGSSGNCTIVDCHNNAIMLDCGVPNIKYMVDNVYDHGSKLCGIFITHAHYDHICRVPIILKHLREKHKDNVPIYITRMEYDSDRGQKYIPQDADVRFVIPNEPIIAGGFFVYPQVSLHDTPMPVHYHISTIDGNVFYGCDCAALSIDNLELINLSDLAIMECNYDEDAMRTDMIAERPIITPYDKDLKTRIKSIGHISAQQMEYYLTLVNPKTMKLLGHVSKVYNSTELLRERFKGVPKLYVFDREQYPMTFIINNTMDWHEYYGAV